MASIGQLIDLLLFVIGCKVKKEDEYIGYKNSLNGISPAAAQVSDTVL